MSRTRRKWFDKTSRMLAACVTIGATTVVVQLSATSANATTASKTNSWAWGDNGYGQLGDGSTRENPSAVPVKTLTDVVAVAAGTYDSMALESNGTVWAWGDNDAGQLGSSSPDQETKPVEVPGLSDVVAIAAGAQDDLALESNGTVWSWGYNLFGELGQGSQTTSGCYCQPSPAQVVDVSDVVAIAAGGEDGMALESNGTVWSWGDNGYGQLGDGSVPSSGCACSPTPSQIPGLSGVTAIAVGAYHAMALLSDGTVSSWGYNYYGQLGSGTAQQSGCDCDPTPAPVEDLSDITAISGGGYHSLALDSNGHVWAWGMNLYGELGYGGSGGELQPHEVPGLDDITAISAGLYHSMAETSGGTLLSWGRAGAGQLGLGTMKRGKVDVPTAVPGLVDVSSFVAGWWGSIAANDGTPLTTSPDLSYSNDPTAGQPVTVVATVLPSNDTGTVSFDVSSDGQTVALPSSCSGVAVSDETAQCTFTPANGDPYAVSASYSGASGYDSSKGTVTVVPIPGTPTGLSAQSATDSSIGLSWDADPGATTYRVYEGTDSGGPYQLVARPSSASAVVRHLTPDTTYYFVVGAANDTGTSGDSTEASATTVDQPPAPTGLSATPGTSAGSVVLSWDAVSGAEKYLVSDSTTSGGPYRRRGSTAKTTAAVRKLTSGTTYYFVIETVSAAGTSSYSAPVSVTAP